MMKQFFLVGILLLSMFEVKAQTIDLSKAIIGDWVFQDFDFEEFIINDESIKDSVLCEFAKMKKSLEYQILTYTSDGKVKAVFTDDETEGTYTIDGNVEFDYFDYDEYPSVSILSIVGDTLFIDYDQTEYFQQETANFDTIGRGDSAVKKIITRYTYIRKED